MIVTVAQEKGGVGKTATAKNLAAVAARGGERVLVIDADPQFALTRQLGIRTGELAVSLVDVLSGRVEAADAIVRDVCSLDVLPSARELRSVELALAGEVGRETFLRAALEPIRERYELIVIDTPPNLGLLTVNALLVADAGDRAGQRRRRGSGPGHRGTARHAGQGGAAARRGRAATGGRDDQVAR